MSNTLIIKNIVINGKRVSEIKLTRNYRYHYSKDPLGAILDSQTYDYALNSLADCEERMFEDIEQDAETWCNEIINNTERLIEDAVTYYQIDLSGGGSYFGNQRLTELAFVGNTDKVIEAMNEFDMPQSSTPEDIDWQIRHIAIDRAVHQLIDETRETIAEQAGLNDNEEATTR